MYIVKINIYRYQLVPRVYEYACRNISFLPSRGRLRQAGAMDWAERASNHLHWYHFERACWLRRHSGTKWRGWPADGSAEVCLDIAWTPWQTLSDECDNLPVVHWFCEGYTNAAFNELDRHLIDASKVLRPDISFIAEDHSEVPSNMERAALLQRSVLASHALLYGMRLERGARLVIYAANRPEVRASILARLPTCLPGLNQHTMRAMPL